MKALVLTTTATLLGACSLLPVTQQPASRVVTVRGEVAPRVGDFALQDLPASWTMPYTADAIATIRVALEQQAVAFTGDVNDSGECDARATSTFPSCGTTASCTALPVEGGALPTIELSGLPLGQYYQVTLRAESASSGTISCPTMSRARFDTLGPSVPEVITTTFPVRLFAPKYETNFTAGVSVTNGDVVASGSAGPSVGAVTLTY
jgi:hypothetical protein